MNLLPHFVPRRDLGHDPDYRFTLANERTFLAWIRTSLALIAGGLAIVQFLPELGERVGRSVLGGSLIVLGTVLAGGGLIRWTAVEEAIRQGFPIPATRLPLVLTGGVMIAALTVGAFLIHG